MRRAAFCLILSTLAAGALAADWTQFRGPGGRATSDETALPESWSETKNLVWKTELPGLGSSSPITAGKFIFLTCYSGYAETADSPGDMSALKRHVVCLDRAGGKIVWTKDVAPSLPESRYEGGNNTWHGYSSSTPASDGQRLYVFFGRSGVRCFDFEGNELWQADVGNRTNGWGSGTSPVLHKNLVIVNASVESGTLYGLDKESGSVVWRAPGVGGAWNSPVLVEVEGGATELVLSLPGRRNDGGRIVGFDPDTGKELWHCAGIADGYLCPTAVAHDGVVYAIGGRSNTAVAVKAGDRGEVEPLWTTNKGSNVASPVYHEGHLYWMHERNGIALCLDASNGNVVYEERVTPRPGVVYASGVVADGKLYYVSQHNGTFVVAARPEFELLSHNTFDDDDRTNASPAVDRGRLLIRSDKYLYCVGTK
ncbi:MAG: PQQ-like beta-propeller repeat protein [Planctomycetia bacterium]|nr:PQQ-like beta-propeller repeat protein [Planctomycetia bacterium]